MHAHERPSKRHSRTFQLVRALCLFAPCLAALGCSGNDDDNIELERVEAPPVTGPAATPLLITQAELVGALEVAKQEAGGGLDIAVWASVLDHTGVVRALAHTSEGGLEVTTSDRVVSAQKANTANAVSTSRFAFASANLFIPMRPGGALYGLAQENAPDEGVATGGNGSDYGTARDFMIGKKPGGVNVFGGGIALYSGEGLVGALGVSGDSPCANHNIAWKIRDRLGLDLVPDGVAPNGTDNIIYDMGDDGTSQSGFGHPACSEVETELSLALPETNPLGS